MLAGLAASAVTAPWLAWSSFTGRHALLAAGAALLAALAWAMGTWLVTAPRPAARPVDPPPEQEWLWLRRTNRITQACWPAAVVGIAAASAIMTKSAGGPAPTATMFIVLAALAAFFAIAGLATMLVHMALLADWANDTALARRLRMAPFGLLSGLVILVALILVRPLFQSALLSFVMIPFALVASLVLLLCLGQFVLAVVQFVSVGVWAERIATNSLDSNRRMSAKIVQRIEAAQSRARATAGDRAPAVAPKHAPQGLYLAPSGEPQAYDLAPQPPAAHAPRR